MNVIKLKLEWTRNGLGHRDATATHYQSTAIRLHTLVYKAILLYHYYHLTYNGSSKYFKSELVKELLSECASIKTSELRTTPTELQYPAYEEETQLFKMRYNITNIIENFLTSDDREIDYNQMQGILGMFDYGIAKSYLYSILEFSKAYFAENSPEYISNEINIPLIRKIGYSIIYTFNSDIIGSIMYTGKSDVNWIDTFIYATSLATNTVAGHLYLYELPIASCICDARRLYQEVISLMRGYKHNQSLKGLLNSMDGTTKPFNNYKYVYGLLKVIEKLFENGATIDPLTVQVLQYIKANSNSSYEIARIEKMEAININTTSSVTVEELQLALEAAEDEDPLEADTGTTTDDGGTDETGDGEDTTDDPEGEPPVDDEGDVPPADNTPKGKSIKVPRQKFLLEYDNPSNDTLSDLLYRQAIVNTLRDIVANPTDNISAEDIVIIEHFLDQYVYLVSIASLKTFITNLVKGEILLDS